MSLCKHIFQRKPTLAENLPIMRSLPNFPMLLFITALCLLLVGKHQVLAASKKPEEEESSREHIRALHPTRELQGSSSLKYTGSRCNVQGPTDGQVVMRFFAFGDTPYDPTPGPPLFQGAEYECLATTILPGMKERAGSADFVMHVGKSSLQNNRQRLMYHRITVSQGSFLCDLGFTGDIKPGSSSYSGFCNDILFGNRRDLFQTLEPDIDFFIVPGDNEWNECKGYSRTPTTADVAKTTWRKYFATGSFEQFGRTFLPSGETPP